MTENLDTYELAEEVRTYMERHKMQTGSVHALSVLRALEALGYKVVKQ